MEFFRVTENEPDLGPHTKASVHSEEIMVLGQGLQTEYPSPILETHSDISIRSHDESMRHRGLFLSTC